MSIFAFNDQDARWSESRSRPPNFKKAQVSIVCYSDVCVMVQGCGHVQFSMLTRFTVLDFQMFPWKSNIV